MKKLPSDEQINAQLRDLTTETRRARMELEQMLRRRGPSPSAFAHDRRLPLKKLDPTR